MNTGKREGGLEAEEMSLAKGRCQDAKTSTLGAAIDINRHQTISLTKELLLRPWTRAVEDEEGAPATLRVGKEGDVGLMEMSVSYTYSRIYVISAIQ